jgi:cell division protein FtsL
MNKKNIVNNDNSPVVRMRHVVVLALFVTVLAAGPLCIVWKQVYITQLSIRQNSVADSVSILSKHAAQLRLTVDRLSETGRIEVIAREKLNMEYPQASNIVIIGRDTPRKSKKLEKSGFFAILRRSITGERG